MSLFLLITVLVICLLLEGFFSGSEIAIVSADKQKLALDAEGGSARAQAALYLVRRPALFFSTTLLGTNLCTISATVVTTFFILDRFGESYTPFAILYWPFTLTFGEIVPKSVYQHNADRIVRRVAPVLLAVSYALYPAVWIFSQLTEMLLGKVRKRGGSEQPISRGELEIMLEVGEPEKSDVRTVERTMISRVFELADTKVRQIMTPLVDVVSVPVNASRADAFEVLEESEFSRVPVVVPEEPFNVVGVLAGMDLLFSEPGKSVRELMRKAYFVPEEMPLDELLIAMKRGGQGIAIAVDEYGGATGIVTVEDLLEEVVGEIRDEHDETPLLFSRVGRHRYVMNGRLEIEDANEKLKLSIPEGPYQTVAGYVMHVLGHIPKQGEMFRVGKHTYRVVRATDRAVLEVEVVRAADKAEGAV
jgi:CBS domain containing-hemolysin-like protein